MSRRSGSYDGRVSNLRLSAGEGCVGGRKRVRGTARRRATAMEHEPAMAHDDDDDEANAVLFMFLQMLPVADVLEAVCGRGEGRMGQR